MFFLLVFSGVTFLSGSSVFASETVGSQDNLLILEDLREIVPDFQYEGELISISEKTGVIDDFENVPANDEPSLRSAISAKYMTIYQTVSRVKEKGKDSFQLKAVATWKTVPTIRVQDAFAISWGGGFALKSSSVRTFYKGVGLLSGKSRQIAQSPNAGVGYSVEASHYYGQALEWVELTAKISNINKKGIANFSAAYAHRKISISGISISFDSKGGGISFSLAGDYDTLSHYTSFEY